MTAAIENQSYASALERNRDLRERIKKEPARFRVLTGERPTGALHVGHYFGSLKDRVALHRMGVDMFLIIADYQALTDRDASSKLKESVHDILLDYLAIGLVPDHKHLTAFCHSYVPELNQLILPFMSLVSVAELDRNPTVKSEIQQLGGRVVTSLMHTYPVHQAADILFCKGNLVPGGKDQLPHVEVTRLIARRFNERYGEEFFGLPELLLGDAPLMLGLDGQKMGKSMGNAIFIKMTEDETRALIKGAKTDSNRTITYEPETRPEVSNLLLLASLCTGKSVEDIAVGIGDGGSGKLKETLTEGVNEFFRDIRKRRTEYAKDNAFVIDVLKRGNEHARAVAAETLSGVRRAMSMSYY